MSINAAKAVAIGEGWEAADMRGSQYHDVIEPIAQGGGAQPATPYPLAGGPWRRATNRSGGTEGGMTNGMPLVARFVVKPISTMSTPLPSVDLVTGEVVQAHYERSDVCQVPAAGVIGEAVVAFVLADAFLEKFGGDHVEETRRNYLGYQKTVGPRGMTHLQE
jgi:chorismate synthase